MKFLNSSFLQHAIGKQGALLEADGEAQFRPNLNWVTDVGGPLFTNTISTSEPQRRTFFTNSNLSVTGASAASINTIATLTAGIWLFDWWYIYAMGGTTDLNKTVQLNLRDPTNNDANIVLIPFVVANITSGQGRFAVDLPSDNWTITSSRSATVAGDTFIFATRLMVFRVLP